MQKSYCNVLPKPKLCTTFEVASFNGFRKNRGPKFFGCCPNPIPLPILVLKVSLAKLLRKPKLYIKFEVVRFNSCRNK